MTISTLVTVGLLIICHLFVKTEKSKSVVLKSSAILTVILHYSPLWVDFFRTGAAEVASPMILPMYPCNVCMWILLVLSLSKKRERTVYQLFAEGLLWVGTVCGIIGVVFNEAFDSTPTLADWDVLKGMLSHSTMIFGILYLRVGGFMKIRVSNVVGTVCVLLTFVACGLIINLLYLLFDLGEANSMYLQEPPFSAMPWLNTWTIGIAAIMIVFTITALYEYIALRKEERWYTKLKIYFEDRKEKQK